MKKLLMLLLVLSMVMGASLMAYAEEAAEEERLPLRERVEARMVKVFEDYYEAGLERYLALKEEHQAFHENAKAEREANRALIREEINALKEQVINGEITREEAKEIIEGKKESLQALKESIQAILEDKKVDAELIREDIKGIHDDLKVVLTAERVDSNQVLNLLDALLVQMSAHLEMDLYYYDLINELLD